jgi:hypothetical protein
MSIFDLLPIHRIHSSTKMMHPDPRLSAAVSPVHVIHVVTFTSRFIVHPRWETALKMSHHQNFRGMKHRHRILNIMTQNEEISLRLKIYEDLTTMAASNAPLYAKRSLKVIQSESHVS